MRPDRREQIRVQKQIAAEEIRLKKLENEEMIRMNQTNYLFAAISKREQRHRHETTRAIQTSEVTQQMERIEKALELQRMSHQKQSCL